MYIYCLKTPYKEGHCNMSFPPNLGITSSFIVDYYSNSSLVLQDLSSLLPPLDQICYLFSRSKMNGYSRITKDTATRSRSVDFADLSFSPNSSRFKSQEIKPNIGDAVKITPMQRSILEDDSMEGTGGVKFHAVVRKTVFISRSSSVSEGYSRIHHQSDFAAEEDDQNRNEFTSQHRHKKKKGKFLEACRRLFRF